MVTLSSCPGSAVIYGLLGPSCWSQPWQLLWVKVADRRNARVTGRVAPVRLFALMVVMVIRFILGATGAEQGRARVPSCPSPRSPHTSCTGSQAPLYLNYLGTRLIV